jgi:small GTP-binding protein
MTDSQEGINFDDMEEIKMILLGEAGCGKTSIISRYTLDKFDSNYFTTYSSTFLTKIFEYKGKKYNINIWDTVGQEKFRSLTKIFIKGTKICLFVYDITNKHSFEEISFWLEQAKQIADKDVVFGMAGNKNDLIGKQQVNDKDAIKFAEDNNIIFGQTSAAKNKSSVDSLLDKLIIKYLENSNPSLAGGNSEEARIKLDAKNNTEPKKDSCSFFKNLFKSKKKEDKKAEKKVFTFISKPNDKKATQKIKISIVGDVNVGKTNLCKVLFNEKYIDTSQSEKKDNIVYNKTLCYNDKYFDVEIIDFAMGEGDLELFKNSDIIICLYVLNNESSYNELINYWYPFIKKNNGNKNAIVGIAENKNDLKNEGGVEFDVDIEKSNDDIKQALEVNNDIIFEKISCKSNLNVIKFFQRIVTKFIEIKK